MKKINSSLPYWCDSSRVAVRMGTDLLFPPRIFSNNYSTNIKPLESKRRLGAILVQCVMPSFYLLFIYWSKSEEDGLTSPCVDIRAQFFWLLTQIFFQLFPYIFFTSYPFQTHILFIFCENIDCIELKLPPFSLWNKQQTMLFYHKRLSELF